MFRCNECGMSFGTEQSLSSHRAWHAGKLKSWKDQAEVRERLNRRPISDKTGREVVRGFLNSILPLYIDEDEIRDLAVKIWELIKVKIRF